MTALCVQCSSTAPRRTASLSPRFSCSFEKESFMVWRRLLSLAVVSLVAALHVPPAAAQLAPTGAHYAAQASDTGFSGGVNSSGGYGASVALDLPASRGGLPIPAALVYRERGACAA